MVHGPLTGVASLVEEHRLWTLRLSSGHGSRAQPLCGMWDLPRLGIEPGSPALAGGFFFMCVVRGPLTVVAPLVAECGL